MDVYNVHGRVSCVNLFCVAKNNVPKINKYSNKSSILYNHSLILFTTDGSCIQKANQYFHYYYKMRLLALCIECGDDLQHFLCLASQDIIKSLQEYFWHLNENIR